MADASLAGHPACDRRTVLLADPRPDRLRPVGEALEREFAVELVHDGGAAFEAVACGRCFVAVIAMALPSLSGLEVLRRLAALRLQRPPLILALGAADDVRLKVVEAHGVAHATQAFPCPPGVLLRIWQLVDRDVERRWSRLPPVQRTLVGTTRGLLGQAGSIVRDGGELEAGSARLAGVQVVEALCARLMGEVLTSLQAYHDYTSAHSFRVATHLATFALATGM